MPIEDFFKYQRRRINPFKGLVIDVPTWADAHNYHRDQQRLHAISMHRYGIVAGLEVVAWNPADSSVVIYPGIAVDSDGNLIVVSETQRFYIKTEESGTAYIVIEYSEIPQEMTQSLDGEKAEPLYIMEAYRIGEQRQPPAEPCMELARVTIAGENAVIRDAQNPLNPGSSEIDTRYRPLAGSWQRGQIALALVDQPSSMRHQEGVLNLVQAINQSTDYRAHFKGTVGLGGEIRDCDLLCMCGSDEFTLTQDQETVLLNFLSRGGVLLGEACREEGQEAKAFGQAFASLAQRLGRNLRSVDRGHAVLKIHHLFAAAPVGLGGPVMLMEDQGMLYSDGDFGCMWAGGKGAKPMPREAIREALELGVNIALYAHERAHYHALRIHAK
ncbi:MAG: DUF4159 domain-containing protein [Dehalococcoidia bacterium]